MHILSKHMRFFRWVVGDAMLFRLTGVDSRSKPWTQKSSMEAMHWSVLQSWYFPSYP